jgi:hypothetical protein
MRVIGSVLLVLCGTVVSAAGDDKAYVKYRFEIAESGSFVQKSFKELGTKEVAALITAGCAAWGVDCSQEALAGTEIIAAIVASDIQAGEQHHGIIRAPTGYEICRAKIDTNHASVDSQTSFSGEIIRDVTGNGLGFYAEVPKKRKEGHSAKADLYLQFVPAGTVAQHDCMPTSNHSDAAHLWIFDRGVLKVMQAAAHY